MVSRSVARGVLAVAATLIVGFATLPRLTAQSSPAVNPALYSGLKWRAVGPFRAGRVNAIAGVTGQPSTFYMGSVGGGLWKTTNIGRTWTPIFDGTNVASIKDDDLIVATHGRGFWVLDDITALRQIDQKAADARDPVPPGGGDQAARTERTGHAAA